LWRGAGCASEQSAEEALEVGFLRAGLRILDGGNEDVEEVHGDGSLCSVVRGGKSALM
jgi:hypothetical protein